MSIEKHASPMSRSFRTLIRKRAALAKPIKDLKDLRVLRLPSAIDIKVLRTLETFFHRSAGACPPRALDAACTHAGEGQALALR